MGGTLDETTFNAFEAEAESLVNWYTFNRLLKMQEVEYPTNLGRCMFSLIRIAKLRADAMALGEQTSADAGGTTAAIASQSNDGVSTSYNTINASEVFNSLAALTKGSAVDITIRTYLNGSKDSLGRNLLYRGVYPDE